MTMFQLIEKKTGKLVGEEFDFGNAAELRMVLEEMNDTVISIVEVEDDPMDDYNYVGSPFHY